MLKYYCDVCGKPASDLVDRHILDVKNAGEYHSWARPDIHMDVCGECYDTLMIMFDKLKEGSHHGEESSKEADEIRAAIRDARAGGRNQP